MVFGLIPSAGSVVIRVSDPHSVLFAAATIASRAPRKIVIGLDSACYTAII
jgi:hypothetical protein